MTELRILEQTYKEVQRRFSGLDDLAHGWEHVERVYQLALYIAERESANRYVVGMAALLHDLGRSAPHNAQHHADLSVELAADLLQQQGVMEERQREILHAIIAHSFSKGVEPRTLEARVVRDADRLDGLGAIGIMRWAITGAVRRTPETRAYHPTDPFGEAHELNDGRYMLDHFYSKLLTLEGTMATTTGRELAHRRTAFMLGYLDELRQELGVLGQG